MMEKEKDLHLHVTSRQVLPLGPIPETAERALYNAFCAQDLHALLNVDPEDTTFRVETLDVSFVGGGEYTVLMEVSTNDEPFALVSITRDKSVDSYV